MSLFGAACLGLMAACAAAAATAPTLRVPLVGDDAKDARVQKYYAGVRERGGQPLNLHRTLANAPALMAGRNAAIRYDATVPRAYRELIIIRSVQLNGGEYEQAQHRPMAMSCGLTRPQVDAIARWRTSRLFDPKQRAVLAYAEGISARTGPSDAVFADMKKHFNDTEIVELTIAATTYAGDAMFTRALRVPLEPTAGDGSSAYGKC